MDEREGQREPAQKRMNPSPGGGGAAVEKAVLGGRVRLRALISLVAGGARGVGLRAWGGRGWGRRGVPTIPGLANRVPG